ncbi:hypothetical protein QE152_g10925 [Popillia japonica]|uniref:Uncharacterized protein n=1 Tax=Popillia japonica TaxID=7064 RepID=A0AAW1LNX1_POPJA
MKCRLKEHGSLALMLAAINVTGSSTPPLNFNLQKEKDSWYLGLKSEIVILNRGNIKKATVSQRKSSGKEMKEETRTLHGGNIKKATVSQRKSSGKEMKEETRTLHVPITK